mgnify:CR=1 FL=1
MVNDVLSMGIRILEAAMSVENPSSNSVQDLYQATFDAFRKGYITKNQYIAVINALDESPIQQTANLDIQSIIRSN